MKEDANLLVPGTHEATHEATHEDGGKDRRLVVEYSLPYEHCVQVGIEAASPEEAIATAERLFNAGEIWDDTQAVPLLWDDYEENDDGTALTFKVVAEVADDWPPAGPCVLELRRRTDAFDAARKLVEAYRRGKESGASIDWEDLDIAYEAALRAAGQGETVTSEEVR